MKVLSGLLFWWLLATVCGRSYFFGEKEKDSKPVYRERVEYYARPWIKRVEFFNYNSTSGATIKAIHCYDYQHTEASVNVTAGGVGFEHVTLRLKSQRSYALDYAIEIFV